MAIFGNQNYGTPFGAIDPSKFFGTDGSGTYSYKGFTNRDGDIENDILCGENGLAFLPYKPTLTFPIGYSVLQGVNRITWNAPAPGEPCETEVTYEVQFTRSFSRDSGWRTINSRIKEKYVDFDVSNIAYSEDCGLRIRARSSTGLFSLYSKSLEAFTVGNHAPNEVTIISPKNGQLVDNELIISWLEANPKDIDGHEVTYQVEITSSYSSNSGWVVIPGGEALISGTTSFIANTFNLPNGADYGIRISAIDILGLGGTPAVVGPLYISHSGLFIIDTIPPVGSILINDGEVLASGTNVKLSVKATDNGTGIKSVRFKNEEDSCWSDWESYVLEKFWKLPGTDGIKRIFVQFQDYAENISGACDCEIVSRVLCEEGNVTDFEVFNDRLYVSFDKNGNLIEFKVLVKQSHEFGEEQVVSLARFDGNLYISTYNPDEGDEESFIYRYDGKNAVKMFSIVDEKIVSMLAYNDVLYMGCLSGNIYSYISGASDHPLSYPPLVDLETYPLLPVERIRTDGRIMFVSTVGGNSFLTGTLVEFEGDEVIEWTVVSQ